MCDVLYLWLGARKANVIFWLCSGIQKDAVANFLNIPKNFKTQVGTKSAVIKFYFILFLIKISTYRFYSDIDLYIYIS